MSHGNGPKSALVAVCDTAMPWVSIGCLFARPRSFLLQKSTPFTYFSALRSDERIALDSEEDCETSCASMLQPDGRHWSDKERTSSQKVALFLLAVFAAGKLR